MSDGLPPHPNVVIKLSLCLYMYYEMNVDDDKYLYQMLFDNTCMLRIGCKTYDSSDLLTWLKLD
jgi:hypothetical protein